MGTRERDRSTAFRTRVDDVLLSFLQERRREVQEVHPAAAVLVDEIERLVRAGGKRLRPAFVYWGYRAAGGPDGPEVLRAGGAVELLHTMALIHDDLMDRTPTRRGVASSHVLVGDAVALLAGDLAAVLADQLLLGSGIEATRLLTAQARYHRMRLDMAAGQYLDVAGVEADVARAADLKGGAYSVRGPLLLGADLAGGTAPVLGVLSRFGEPLGRAFQHLDDLRDGEAPEGLTRAGADALVDEAVGALDPDVLGVDAADALAFLAATIGAR